MARPIRIQFSGAYYHVINRGQNRQNIFLDEKDFQTFLNVMINACETCNVEIVAYCLMTNHYHLVIHTPDGNLSKFMRQVNGIYTQLFNKRHKRDGSLFKGRYKSIIAQNGIYVLKLARYAHMNPVRAKMVTDCSEYQYSSHRDFLKGKETSWLKFKETLKIHWPNCRNLVPKYKEFMNKTDEEVEAFCLQQQIKSFNSSMYGDDRFVDTIKRKYLGDYDCDVEIPQSLLIKNDIIINSIKTKVAENFNVGEQKLLSSIRGVENIPRMMAVSIARECTGLSYKSIAELFNLNTYKNAAKYYERFSTKKQNNYKLTRRYERLKQRCSQVET